MALQKEISTQYGIIADYWKINQSNINWGDKSSHIEMVGYVSQESRINGDKPIDSRGYDWSGEDFPFNYEVMNEEGNNVVNISYERIKTLEEFKDSVDI